MTWRLGYRVLRSKESVGKLVKRRSQMERGEGDWRREKEKGSGKKRHSLYSCTSSISSEAEVEEKGPCLQEGALRRLCMH